MTPSAERQLSEAQSVCRISGSSEEKHTIFHMSAQDNLCMCSVGGAEISRRRC